MDYRILRSSRKTIALQIMPDGQLVVRCPQRMGNDAIGAFVESKRAWINKHMAKHLAHPVQKLTDTERQQLKEQARELVSRRVAYYASVMSVSYNRIAIRSQQTRWGSCSSKGNLNFNCLLALVPREILDYVVVHELCHRKQLNHSERFWEEVARVLPDYKERRKWLKDYGPQLIAKL